MDAGVPIEVIAGPRFVGRGGLKLDAAIAHFAIAVSGRTCLDIGASTGGFTDCLLQRGAARVHAVDVGAGQLDWKIRNDPRVAVHEKLNARYLRPEDLGEPIDLAVCDVSFISVTLILPAIVTVLQPAAKWLYLSNPSSKLERDKWGRVESCANRSCTRLPAAASRARCGLRGSKQH